MNTTPTQTFATMVAEAYEKCKAATAPWTPSRADQEKYFQPVVDLMLSLDPEVVSSWVKYSFRGFGMPSLVLQMYKEQLVTPQEDDSMCDAPMDEDVREEDYVGYESAAPARFHDDGFYAKNDAGEYSWM